MAATPVILGLGAATGHDSGAALLVDGRLVAAVEEERLSRRKHDPDFPRRSIDYCLKAGQVSQRDVDYVALGSHPSAGWWRRLAFLAHPGTGFNLWRKTRFLRSEYLHPLMVEQECRGLFPRARFVFVEHHLAHAASAFYCSPFDEAAILTTDGRGEWSTGVMAKGAGPRITKIAEAFFPQSLGFLYTAFTQYLGFHTHDEYKVMGLSSYGHPEYLDLFRRIVRFHPTKLFQVDLSWLRHPSYAPVSWGERYYSAKVEQTFGPARRPDEPVTALHKNLAKSLQVRFEEIGVELASDLQSRTGSRHLAMAGGVCLNGLMNYAIKASGVFDRLFVQPASNDGGISVGAAFHVQHQVLGHPRTFDMRHAYWGPSFSETEIRRELDICRLPYLRLDNAPKTAAGLLASGHVIGWFQGRAELGPRALGNRSILADPRDPKNKDLVNARIKFREEFRPFAPSVLAEQADRLFDKVGESPYMLLICPVRPETAQAVPAVIHVDGPTRPQTVTAEANPRYHALIEEFYRLTGVPVVLNTSFNVKGEPIVNSPSDAIRCFFGTGLDYLILGDFLVGKGSLPNVAGAAS